MACSSIIIGHKLSCGLCLNSYQKQSQVASTSKLALSNYTNGIRLSSNKSRLAFDLINTTRRSLVVYANIGAPLPSTPPPSGSGYMSWVIGIVISVIILPFFSRKMGSLRVLKHRIENAVQMVEDAAEAVEKIAGEVDKIAEHIADDLPEGELKDMVRRVEHEAEKVASAADALDNVIDKVQEVEEQVESIVESVATKNTQK